MKRNNDLIRAILKIIERECAGGSVISITTKQTINDFPSVPQEILDEHIRLLAEKDFIDASPTQFYWMISRIKWSGQDFLAMSCDLNIWEKAKNLAGHLGFDLFASTLKELTSRAVNAALSN